MFKKILISGYCALFAINAFATEDLYAPILPQVWSSIITLSGGPVWSNSGKSEYLYPFPAPMFNYYLANSQWDILGSGELFFGLQHFIGDSSFIGQLGLGVVASSGVSLSGVVNVNGVANVYTYLYQVREERVELKGKLIANGFRLVQPYASASVALGINSAYDYSATTIDSTLYPIYWFHPATTVAISYSVGAGLQKMLTPNWQVGVGYEFADWGHAYLGGDGVVLTRGPGVPHIYTNELLCSVSYMF